MIVVAVHNLAGDPGEAERLARTLDRAVFEIRQRLTGIDRGPVVLALSAGAEEAGRSAEKLDLEGFNTLVFDSREWREGDLYAAERFDLEPQGLILESEREAPLLMPWRDLEVLVRGMRIPPEEPVEEPQPRRRFGRPSSGTRRGGLEGRQELPERKGFLYLAGKRQRVLLREDKIDFSRSHGEVLRLSREENFDQMTADLRRRSPGTPYDQRLLTRAGQTRILGPQLPPERFWPLAAGLVAASLMTE